LAPDAQQYRLNENDCQFRTKTGIHSPEEKRLL